MSESHRIHIRLTSEQTEFIKTYYPNLGISVVLRRLLDDHIRVMKAKFNLDLKEQVEATDDD